MAATDELVRHGRLWGRGDTARAADFRRWHVARDCDAARRYVSDRAQVGDRLQSQHRHGDRKQPAHGGAVQGAGAVGRDVPDSQSDVVGRRLDRVRLWCRGRGSVRSQLPGGAGALVLRQVSGRQEPSPRRDPEPAQAADQARANAPGAVTVVRLARALQGVRPGVGRDQGTRGGGSAAPDLRHLRRLQPVPRLHPRADRLASQAATASRCLAQERVRTCRPGGLHVQRALEPPRRGARGVQQVPAARLWRDEAVLSGHPGYP